MCNETKDWKTKIGHLHHHWHHHIHKHHYYPGHYHHPQQHHHRGHSHHPRRHHDHDHDQLGIIMIIIQTLGRGNPDAWHLRLTVEPFFTTRLPDHYHHDHD